jgi:hypothetical protein
MEFDEPEYPQHEEQNIAIYSKWAILLFSVFFSPLIGGVLLMLNLRSAGYKREGTGVLLFAVAYQFIAGIVVSSIVKLPSNATMQDLVKDPKFLIYTLVAQIIGGGILAEYFFNKYFPDDNYERKSIWIPLVVIILITISLNLLLRF